jgi:hypothetical protein
MRTFIKYGPLLGVTVLALAGCGTTTEQKAASGAGAGVIAGAVVAGPVGAAVGAAVGGAGGAAKGQADENKPQR